MESTELTKEQLTALREKSLNDLYFFAKGVLGFDLLDKDIHQPICDLLEDPANTRLTVVLPRSWLKSTLVSIAYPIWRAIRDPNVRILIVQNSHSNACKKLAVIRGKFESCALFRALFPDLLPDKDCIWSNDSLQIKRSAQHAEGTFEAAGTRTKVVSRHYNLIIEDDTVAPDQDEMNADNILPSSDDVEQAIGWHRLAAPLLVNFLQDQNIIVGTRWFERDLISWNQEKESRSYKRYERACRETNGLADEDGEITYPSRFSKEVLDGLLDAMGPYLFSCLYMNKPLRSKDMVFQVEWFQYYEQAPRDMVCYTTVDLASDPNEIKGDPDYNVVMTCGKDLTNGGLFVLDYFRAKCSPGEVIQAIFDHVRRFSPVKVGIESIQYQSSQIYWVRERQKREGLHFRVEPISHGKRSKNSRIQGLQPLVHAGEIRFRTHHQPLISELIAFPLARNDDLGDALSMQIPMWAITRSKKELQRDDPASNPMSFENAKRELYAQAAKRRKQIPSWATAGN